ncbi:acyltransferase [Psychromonas ossibalaenae]|uniref:acyltransferase n=1 Tax=Psychromonas ossibalaenae TaxID=444922 RepID=UPI00037198C0|nr:acyltransferase [Psychromonas ossibalaenae]
MTAHKTEKLTAPTQSDYLPWTRNAEQQEKNTQYKAKLSKQYGYLINHDAFISEQAVICCDDLTLGSKSYIAAQAILRGSLNIANNVSINNHVQISGKVTIGQQVRIASMTTIVGFNHGFEDIHTPIYKQPCTSKGIVIGENVWIGASVVICDGVKIGANSIIAAGSIVVKDLPASSICAGNPAKVIRSRIPNTPVVSTCKVSSSLRKISKQIQQQWSNIQKFHNCSLMLEQIQSQQPFPSDNIRPLCDMVEIASALNRPVEFCEKGVLIEKLQNLQLPCSGLIGIPGKEQSLLDISDHYPLLSLGYALQCLDSQLKWPVHAVNKINKYDLYTHLSQLDWKHRAWGSGAWIDLFSSAVYLQKDLINQDEKDKLLNPLFAWLNINNLQATGMWASANQESQWLKAVNGFYRLTRGSYAQFSQPLPYPESSIDTILCHSRINGHFLRNNITACNVLDIIHPLCQSALQTDYRQSEIKALFEQQIPAITERWQNNQGFAFSPDQTASLQGTEMWMSILATAAEYLGMQEELQFTPKGIHQLSN